MSIDPYYICIAIFGCLSIAFSFGDIENSKNLQIGTTYLRFFVVILLLSGSLYYLGVDGIQSGPVFDWGTQKEYLATVFGNTVFVFVYHHSVSGIIYPVRP